MAEEPKAAAGDAQQDRFDAAMKAVEEKFQARFTSLEATLKKQFDATPITQEPSNTGVWWLDTAINLLSRLLISGLFFILLGGAILYWSYAGLGKTHGSFTFVQVVLGAAILLYGTGTQSLGSFANQVGATQYKVMLAGGAGVLAFATAFGLAYNPERMRKVFDLETKHLKVRIEPKGDGKSLEKVGNYLVQFYADGVPIPSKVESNSYVGYLPFRDIERGTARKVKVTMILRALDTSDPLFEDTAKHEVSVVFDKGTISEYLPGHDYSEYTPPDAEVPGAEFADVKSFKVGLLDRIEEENGLARTAERRDCEPISEGGACVSLNPKESALLTVD